MKKETRSSYSERILRVMLYLQRHLDEPVSLEGLAGIAHFSPYHFHRIFKALVGESVAGHRRRLLLERAAVDLARSRRSITEIAYDAGYENSESFTRAFKGRFGLNPTEYKMSSAQKLENGLHLVGLTNLNKKELEMSVKVKRIEKRKVAFVRHIGPYAECGPAWEKLCAWAGAKGLLGSQTTYLGLSYDDPEVTEPSKIRYDAAVTAGDSVKPEGEIGVQEIPAGEYAVYLHKGPLDKLKDSYAFLCGHWVVQSGREVRDEPCVEVYLNEVGKVAPEDLEVEIQVPLE